MQTSDGTFFDFGLAQITVMQQQRTIQITH
jgi:hypothetical protein